MQLTFGRLLPSTPAPQAKKGDSVKESTEKAGEKATAGCQAEFKGFCQSKTDSYTQPRAELGYERPSRSPHCRGRSPPAPLSCCRGLHLLLALHDLPIPPQRPPSTDPPLPLRLVPPVHAVLLQPLPHLGQVAAGGRAVQLAQVLLPEIVRTGGTRR